MLKRIMLMTATMVCICLCLLIYRQVTRESEVQPSHTDRPTPSPTARSDEIKRLDAGPVGIAQAEKMHYIHRDEKGRVTREFGFAKRVGSGEGRLQISQPWVRFYDRDQRIIKVTAQTGSVPVETAAGTIRLPENGYLEGDVRIEIYGRPEAAPEQDVRAPVPTEPNRPLEILVEMERVEFEREFSRLMSPGEVNVRSAQFGAEGRNLSLLYDQLNDRLQELELRSLRRLTLADQAAEVAALPSQPAPGRELVDEAAAPSDQQPVKKKTATYRLSLSDNVVVDQGGQKLAADFIEILADFDYSRAVLQESSSTVAGGVPHATASSASGRNGTAIEAPVVRDSLVRRGTTTLTCTGPLRITTVEEVPPSVSGARLEFVAYGKPARVFRAGEAVIEADVMRYDKPGESLGLLADGGRMARLSLAPRQWATAQHEVRVDQRSGLATLTGPGVIEYASPSSNKPAKVNYQGQLMIKFAGAATGAFSGLSLGRRIEWLEFAGHLHAQDEDGQVEAERGRLTFYTAQAAAIGSGESAGAELGSQIRSIELWEDVKGSGEDRSLQGEHISAHFDFTNDARSELQSILAEGMVRMEDPNYIIEAGEKIELAFADNPEEPGESAAQETDERGKDQKASFGFEKLVGRGSVISCVLAVGPGGKVRLTSKREQIQIVGDQAQGDALSNVWTVEGDMAQVMGIAGRGRLEGRKITADLDAGLCEVPGRGVLDVTSNKDLLGAPAEKPIPVHIEWEKGATYSIKGGEMAFDTVLTSVQQQTERSRRHTELACPRMTIQLIEQSSTDSRKDIPELADRQLTTLTAHGPAARVISKEYDLETSGLLSTLQIESAQLHFDNNTQLLTAQGIGWIDLANHKEASAQEDKKLESSLSKILSSTLSQNVPSRTLLQFGQQMCFNAAQGELQFSGGVGLDYLPASDTIRFLPAGVADVDGTWRLDCQQLTVVLDQQGQATELQAAGRVFFETFRRGRHHIFSGQLLAYSTAKDLLTFTGTDLLPARFDQMQFRRIQYKLSTGDFEADPIGQTELASRF